MGSALITGDFGMASDQSNGIQLYCQSILIKTFFIDKFSYIAGALKSDEINIYEKRFYDEESFALTNKITSPDVFDNKNNTIR